MEASLMCVLCGPDRAEAVVDHSIDHPFKLKPETDYECAECGQHVSVHPDKLDFLAKQSMESIIEHGHQVRVIFASEERPDFAYSIGRTLKERPELFVIGPMDPNMLGYIVNRVAELDDESPLSAGMELDTVLDGFKVRLSPVRDLEEAQMFGVTTHFSDATALQILWPDIEGNFPGEPGYDADYVQPVFA
jgi:hypothetical protein